jgi:hypothetical protein
MIHSSFGISDLHYCLTGTEPHAASSPLTLRPCTLSGRKGTRLMHTLSSHGATHDSVQKPISFPRHRSRTRTQTHNEKAGAVGAFLPRLNQRAPWKRSNPHTRRPPRTSRSRSRSPTPSPCRRQTPLLARSASPSQPPVKSILHSQDTLAFSAHKPPHPQIARKPRFSFLIDPSIHHHTPLREHARALVATRS